ncbi:MAG: metalloregulator ArsR/SmtB family transcription factor [Woeseiaceae bacterium]|jgi:DNA-binding transcriptional ArsR family regulator|nr:metalloregulator ArsR/SmtB family transcription factor [Woeseiaceae bacterium]
MPTRRIVAKELGAFLKVLSNPDRILIVHALAVTGASSVNALAERLNLPPARVSQHLSLLRAFRIVTESSEGQQRIYTLVVDHLPEWLLEGVDFVADRLGEVSTEQAEEAKRLWVEGSELPTGSR